MANKKKEKPIEIDLGGVVRTNGQEVFDDKEKIIELEKKQLGNSEVKQIQTSAPTYKPKNWYQQISLTANNLWVNINNVWNKFINANGTTTYTATGAGFKDEDNMASDSAVATASQQSIKKYVDNSGLWEVEGAENQLKTADESDMQTKKIINVVDPTADQEVATKKYVDDEVAKPFTLTVSDNLQQSADTERSFTNASYALKKEIQIYIDGNVRIKFDLDFVSGGFSRARIYINDIAIGTERTVGSGGYQTFSQDFICDKGDKIQLYAFQGGGGTGKIRNFRIYYDKAQIADTVVNTD